MRETTSVAGSLSLGEGQRLQVLLLIGTEDAARRVTIDLDIVGVDAVRLFEAQQTEPVLLAGIGDAFWAFRGAVVKSVAAIEQQVGEERRLLLIKQCVLREERRWEKIEREVEAFNNMDRLPDARRERIPDSVRLFVWQRDEGKCVQCGSQFNLEFDHVIPVVKGGANTERNLRLLCESCNRRKGADIA